MHWTWWTNNAAPSLRPLRPSEVWKRTSFNFFVFVTWTFSVLLVQVAVISSSIQHCTSTTCQYSITLLRTLHSPGIQVQAAHQAELLRSRVRSMNFNKRGSIVYGFTCPYKGPQVPQVLRYAAMCTYYMRLMSVQVSLAVRVPPCGAWWPIYALVSIYLFRRLYRLLISGPALYSRVIVDTSLRSHLNGTAITW
jgi:hypothetical protein